MQHEAPIYPSLRPRAGVLVVDGYGIRVRVYRGQLHISDGIGDERRERSFRRSSRELHRILLLGHEGYLTLEAIRWMTDVGIGFVHLDRDGRVISTSAICGLDDPRLRRAQALTQLDGRGVDLARDIIEQKIRGHARVFARLGGDPAEITRWLPALADAPTVKGVLQIEGAAALAYWQGWTDVGLGFGKAASAVPEHWTRVGLRGSGLGGRNRLATSPANAVLNYNYALAEAECRLALLAVGLDPGLGVLHVDQKSRDSMALDLLEVIRPDVDEWVLGLVQSRTLRAKDFFETRQGTCRILAPLTHTLAETIPLWRRLAGSAAERLARSIAAGAGLAKPPTPLTQTNRSSSRPGGAVVKRVKTPIPLPACRGCGAPITPTRLYCDACFIELDQVGDFARSGPAALARMRAEGHDPSATPEARRKIGASNLRHSERRAAWEMEHPVHPPPGEFTERILPRIQGIPLRAISDATGLSLTQCARIRKGLAVPHPMHWDTFENACNR